MRLMRETREAKALIIQETGDRGEGTSAIRVKAQIQATASVLAEEQGVSARAQSIK